MTSKNDFHFFKEKTKRMKKQKKIKIKQKKKRRKKPGNYYIIQDDRSSLKEGGANLCQSLND